VNLVPPSELANWVCSIEGIEGITLSGGEPFEQAGAVVELLHTLKTVRPNLTIFLFTGYEMDVLEKSDKGEVQALLSMADMLSSGPFVAELFDSDLLWRGSSNQRLIYCSNAYSQNDEPKWTGISPVEEVKMNATGFEYTGFKGKSGVIYNHLKSMKMAE